MEGKNVLKLKTKIKRKIKKYLQPVKFIDMIELEMENNSSCVEEEPNNCPYGFYVEKYFLRLKKNQRRETHCLSKT